MADEYIKRKDIVSALWIALYAYEDKTEKQLANWHNMILSYIKEKDMIKTPDCSYALYIKKKFPQVWEQYEKEEGVD